MSRAASPSALARWSSSTSGSGGFHRTTVRSARGARVVAETVVVDPRQLESKF